MSKIESVSVVGDGIGSGQQPLSLGFAALPSALRADVEFLFKSGSTDGRDPLARPVMCDIGWGITISTDEKVKRIDVPVVERATYEEAIRIVRFFKDLYITSSGKDKK